MGAISLTILLTLPELMSMCLHTGLCSIHTICAVRTDCRLKAISVSQM